jgi:hypothetical protein
VLHAIADWWDGIELWLTQQWFPVQLAVVFPVLLPALWLMAATIDRVVDAVSARIAAARSGSRPNECVRASGVDPADARGNRSPAARSAGTAGDPAPRGALEEHGSLR